MPQSILVTGAAGFIGSRLAKVLLERGDRVIGLDNLNDYYPLVHKRRNLADLQAFPTFTFVEMDLCDAEGMAQLVKQHQPQVIAHLAAMAAVRYSVKHPLVYGHVNVQGSMNLMDAARQFGNPRLVMASTGSTYGATTPVPFLEAAPCNQPLAPYPASKRAMELMAYSFHHLYELPITILRFFNVYGPHGRPDMMPWQWTRMIHHGQPLTLFDGGRLKRDWTYIDDIVDGFVAALDKPLGYEIINLGCSRPVENLQFVQKIEHLLGKKATIVDTPCPPSEPPVTFANINKARTMLGYDPRISVETGLARFIDWMRAQNLLD